MAKRSGFLYEALRARSRGSATERISRSAVGASRGFFSWIGDRASDATSAVTGRRRRGTSPSTMLIGVAASILVVGFLLGRWSMGFGGTGDRSDLSSTHRTPGYPVPEEQLVVPPAGHVVGLAFFPDREWRRAMDIAQALASDQYPSTRLVAVSKPEGKYHALVVAGTEGQMRAFADRLRAGRIANPVPRLISDEMWATIEQKGRYIGPL